MQFSAFTVLVTSILAATPASAAEIQAVSVDESIFAMGPFLFIERVLVDNLGDRTGQLTDVVLIARSLETNQDVYMWPISRTLDMGPDHVETADNPRIKELPLQFINKPWQIVSYHHGRIANVRKANDDSAIEVLRSSDGMLISAKTPDFAYEPPKGTPPRTSYWLSHANLGEIFDQSLSNTRYEFEPYYVAEFDTLIGVESKPAEDCKFDYFAQLSEQTDGEQQASWAAKVTCENKATSATVSMFITLQALP